MSEFKKFQPVLVSDSPNLDDFLQAWYLEESSLKDYPYKVLVESGGGSYTSTDYAICVHASESGLTAQEVKRASLAQELKAETGRKTEVLLEVERLQRELEARENNCINIEEELKALG